MHPNLAQGIAAERRADMRRDADAYRRARDHSPADASATAPDAPQRAGRSPAPLPRHGRIRPLPGQRRQAAHKHVALSTTADGTPAHRGANEMLVLPDGTAETAESAHLCSASR